MHVFVCDCSVQLVPGGGCGGDGVGGDDTKLTVSQQSRAETCLLSMTDRQKTERLRRDERNRTEKIFLSK